MPENISIEVRCNKNSGGTYNASTFVNGKLLEEADLSVNRGNCDAIALLYDRLKKLHPGIKPRIRGLDKMCMEKILR